MARRALALLARPVEPAAEAVVSAAQPPAVRTTPVAEPAADFAVGELSARPERRQREPRLALVWPMLRSQKHPSDHRIPRAWRSAAEEPPAAERLVRPAADEGVTPVVEGLLRPAAEAHAGQSNSPIDRPRLALVWPMLRSQIHPSDHRIPRAWPGRNCFEQLATDRAA